MLRQQLPRLHKSALSRERALVRNAANGCYPLDCDIGRGARGARLADHRFSHGTVFGQPPALAGAD